MVKLDEDKFLSWIVSGVILIRREKGNNMV